MNTVSNKIKEKALLKSAWDVEIKDGVTLVFSPLLKKYPNLVHAFTTRKGGNSPKPLDSFNIGLSILTNEAERQDALLNRTKLCQALGMSHENLTTGKLVHSADVAMLEKNPIPGEIDGIATGQKGVPVYITYADCVPIIIYDPTKNIFCLVHAGWRGTAGAISREAIKMFVNECGSKPNDLLCAIGPAICINCYPVGADVVSKLAQTIVVEPQLSELAGKGEIAQLWSYLNKLDIGGFFNYDGQQIHTDLKAINAYQLLTSGVEKVDVTDFCTSCLPELFYSYRRSYVNNEGQSGRQAALACLI